MIRLVLAGPDSRILATLCASCPHSPAGCCAGPPRFDWSDVGRVVARGGVDWLLAEIAAGRLTPVAGGLAIGERKGIARPGGPRMAKCAYHDASGCTIAPDRRPGTCNYFVCESALASAPGADLPGAGEARALQASLARDFTRWDASLAAEVVAAWPDGPPFDRPFFAWLGQRFDALAGQALGVDANVEAHT
jgi:hypothetical protein